jgi:hypothetical protein
MYPRPIPEIPLFSQLQMCNHSLSTATKVEEFLNKSERAGSEEDSDEFRKKQELLGALRQSRDICFETIKANKMAIQKLSSDMADISGNWSNNGENASLPSTTPYQAERIIERKDN